MLHTAFAVQVAVPPPVSYTHLDVYKRQAYALDSQRCGAGDMHGWTIAAAYRNRVDKALLAHNDFDFPAACIRQGQRSGQRQTVQGQRSVRICLLYTSRCV